MGQIPKIALTTFLNFGSRLFYLFRGSRMSWMKEEILFHILYWLSPVTSALVVMMEWLEATYHIEDPLMVFYRVVQNKSIFH